MNIGNPAAAMRNFLSVQQMNQGNQIFNSPSLNNRIYYPNNSYIQNDEVLRRAQLSLFEGADQFHMNLLASQQNSANHLRDEYMVRKKRTHYLLIIFPGILTKSSFLE